MSYCWWCIYIYTTHIYIYIYISLYPIKHIYLSLLYLYIRIYIYIYIYMCNIQIIQTTIFIGYINHHVWWSSNHSSPVLIFTCHNAIIPKFCWFNPDTVFSFQPTIWSHGDQVDLIFSDTRVKDQPLLLSLLQWDSCHFSNGKHWEPVVFFLWFWF
jgi:hypothetical protein